MLAQRQIADITKEVLNPFWAELVADLVAEKVSVKDGLAEAKRTLQGILSA